MTWALSTLCQRVERSQPAVAAPGFGASTVQVAFDHLFSFGSIVGPEGFDVGNLELSSVLDCPNALL